ncbi:serine hydrolase domain-containing protein [Altererythrobacter aquiaggeris]|uniref:serine hydrolase domain-containing protein n=1 Tax=Aestuarierythrobacter aquiaggeris TaxID=1898396 RepID=UPI00301B1F8D
MFSRKTVIIGAAMIGASLLPTAAFAADDDIAAQVAALLEKSYPAEGPGAAIIVTDNGDVVYSGGQGLANVEAGTPISPDTVFRLASISKQFAAATVLRLAEQGKLSLGDPLSKFLPDYPAPGADVTVRQLLNHTSGIQSYTGIAGWMTEANTSQVMTTNELIAEFSDLPANFPAGQAFLYNNSGYVLLGAIIEKVTGNTWHGAIVDQIARPLGLGSIAGFHDESALPGMATGYSVDNNGAVVVAQKIHADVPHAAGGLRGTVRDLAKWAAALHGGKVIGDASYKMMIAPTVLPDGKTENYGFGIAPSKLRGADAIGHSGGIFGFTTDSIYLPEEDVFVAVFVNSDAPPVGAGTLMTRAAAIAIGRPFAEFTAVDPDLAELADKFGVYRINETDTRTFYERGGKLFTMRSGNSASEIFATDDGTFFYGPDSLTWFRISTDKAGQQVMEMHQNGADEAELAVYEGPIVEDELAIVPRAILETYVGTYTTIAGPMVVTLSDADVLSGKLGGQSPIPLAPLSDTKFKVTAVDATVTFTSEGGAVTGLVIEQGGQQIPGERVSEAD